MLDAWPWATLAALGAFHGLNPAMGWLFAVGLGLQERSRKAVLRSLVPIALGHAASLAAVAAAFWLARALVDLRAIRLVAAGAIVGFGGYRLVRGFRHRARVGLRAGFSDLLIWSFLVSTAHGAGLMIMPPLLGLPGPEGFPPDVHSHRLIGSDAAASIAQTLAAVVVHTAVMLLVAAIIAVVVFEWVGLGILRSAWINLDLLWALALIGAGAGLLLL